MRAEGVKLGGERGEPLFQLGVELLELVREPAQLGGIDDGLRHGATVFQGGTRPEKAAERRAGPHSSILTGLTGRGKQTAMGRRS